MTTTRELLQQALNALEVATTPLAKDRQEVLAAITAIREHLARPEPEDNYGKETPCSTHPDAPHGFDRNGSHNAGRYVCNCEGWEPEK
jgi:hypothetical protein